MSNEQQGGAPPQPADVTQMMAMVAQLAGQIGTTSQTMHLAQQIDAFASLLAELQAQAPAPPSVTLPPVFNGKDRSNAQRWIAQCDLFFADNPTSYTTGTEKVGFAAALLDGLAFGWVVPILRPTSVDPIRNDWSLFKKAFEAFLGYPDLQGRSQREIVRLRQTGSCAEYAVRFQTLSFNTGMCDTALIFIFESGLKTKLREALLFHPLHKKWPDHRTYIEAAVKLDSQLCNTQRAAASAAGHQASLGSWAGGYRPAIQQSPERHAQREERRRRRRLCFRCGASDHSVANCPNART